MTHENGPDPEAETAPDDHAPTQGQDSVIPPDEPEREPIDWDAVAAAMKGWEILPITTSRRC
jgi:hypothetical protein